MSRSCAYRTTDKWHLNMDDSKQLTSKYNTDWIIVIVIMMMVVVVVVVVMTMTIMQKVVVLIICCIVGEFVAEWWIRNAWSLNCLKAELNPICHLLSLLGAHHIFHVSRIRVKDRSLHALVMHTELILSPLRACLCVQSVKSVTHYKKQGYSLFRGERIKISTPSIFSLSSHAFVVWCEERHSAFSYVPFFSWLTLWLWRWTFTV